MASINKRLLDLEDRHQPPKLKVIWPADTYTPEQIEQFKREGYTILRVVYDDAERANDERTAAH